MMGSMSLPSKHPIDDATAPTLIEGDLPLDFGELPSESDLDFLMPQPTAQGVSELQELYRRKFNRELTEGEAQEILAHLITIVFNIYLTQLECSDTDSMPENRTMTKS